MMTALRVLVRTHDIPIDHVLGMKIFHLDSVAASLK